MPAAAEIVGVLLVFGDDEDFRMAGLRLDELVHVERAEAPAERQMPLRRQMLVAEEDDAMVEQRLVHVGGGRIVELARQINPLDNRAERAADRLFLNRLVSHLITLQQRSGPQDNTHAS